MSMTRRDALKTVAAAFGMTGIETGYNYRTKTKCPPRQRMVRFKLCAWVRTVEQQLKAGEFTMAQLHAAMEFVLTQSELNDRLNLALLPHDLQDEIDNGKMTLDRGIILSHDRDPREIWEKCKTLYRHQILLLVHVRKGTNSMINPCREIAVTWDEARR